jgi:hypothetical protein
VQVRRTYSARDYGPNADAIGMRPTKAQGVSMDSLLEGAGFEPSAPRDSDDGFRSNSPA